MGLKDRSCVEPYKRGGIPDWTHGLSPRSVWDRPRVEPYKRGVIPNWTQMFCLVFDTMLLSSHVEKVSVSRRQGSSGAFPMMKPSGNS